MKERFEKPIHEPEVIEFLEIGGGRVPGASIYDLSPSIEKRIDAGSSVVTLDREEEGLALPQYGAVLKQSMQTFANSTYLNGRVKNLFINNVCSERAGIVNAFAANLFFSGLKNKLTHDGRIIIIENYTPSEVLFLKDLNYASLGLKAEITQNEGEYRKKLAELDIAESDVAQYFVFKHQKDFKIPWEPFVIVLTRIDGSVHTSS